MKYKKPTLDDCIEFWENNHGKKYSSVRDVTSIIEIDGEVEIKYTGTFAGDIMYYAFPVIENSGRMTYFKYSPESETVSVCLLDIVSGTHRIYEPYIEKINIWLELERRLFHD